MVYQQRDGRITSAATDDSPPTMDRMIVELAINASIVKEREDCAKLCDAAGETDLAAIIRNRN